MSASRIGLLLVNLGTPQGADYWSVRRYLREFLSDRRVVDLPPLLWRPILEVVVLTFRPRRSARAYRSVWNKERDEGPLKTITRAQAEKLAARALHGYGRHRRFRHALRRAIDRREDRRAARKGLRAHSLFPLYPQYAASTTASVFDDAARALASARAADAAHRPALLRRSRLYTSARRLDARAARGARFCAGGSDRVFPRIAAGADRPRRPLSPPLRGDARRFARGARHVAGASASRLSIALRPHAMDRRPIRRMCCKSWRRAA